MNGFQRGLPSVSRPSPAKQMIASGETRIP